MVAAVSAAGAPWYFDQNVSDIELAARINAFCFDNNRQRSQRAG